MSWKITKPLRFYKAFKRSDNNPDSISLPVYYPPVQFEKQSRNEGGKRILIVSPDIVGPIRNGGIGTANTSLAIRLAARGFKVDLLYTLGEHCEGEDDIAFWISQYRRAGVHLIPIPNQAKNITLDAPWYRITAWHTFQWMREHGSNYDLCIGTEWQGDLYYLMLARDTGIVTPSWPIIIVTHSPTVWANEGNYRLPKTPDDLDLDFMERQVVERADVLVSPSAYMMEWEKSRSWKLPDTTLVIPNLLLPPIATKPSMVTTNITELVFFGRLETRKGLDLFLRALSRVPASTLKKIKQLTFLGKRPPKHETDDIDSRIENIINPMGIRCVIIDNRDSGGAIEYLRGEGCLAIIASLMENSPYTVWECLHHGIPFIASHVGGIAELIATEDRESVLFNPNPSALAHILIKILEDGATTAKPILSLDAAEDQWIHLIQSTQKTSGHQKVFNKPLVSICLVHHERPILLAQAVESLRQQDYQNFEVILIDDGSHSPDSTAYLDVLESDFLQREWRIIRQDNAYLGSARNHAAREAKGEWLLFMDDDNVAKSHEVSTFMRAAQSSGADILTCFTDTFTGIKPPEQSKVLWLPLGGDIGGGLFRNVYGDANALIRKSVFDAVGGFTEDYGIGHEDWEFFHKAVQQGYRLELIPEPLFWYRIQKNGMLRAGDSVRDHARSARAIMSTPGIGTALGYALNIHLQQQIRHDGSVGSKRSATIREAYHLYRAKRHQFWKIKKQYGWAVAIGKALDVLSRR